MGRIKSKRVKSVTKQLVKAHPTEFSIDFNINKDVLKKYAIIKSRKLRNVIAGYASRLVKQSKEGRQRRKVAAEDLSKYY